MSVEEKYWEHRYFSGGTSGPSSVGKGRLWKWSIIDEFVPELNHVVDVGCGDLSFWGERDCDDYVGIDISSTVIEKNREKRPKWQFLYANAKDRVEGLRKETVLCMSLLFHIMDEDSFIKILDNLCYYSKKYIFIYNWKNNPFSKSLQKRRFKEHLFNLKPRSALRSLKNLFGEEGKVTDGKYQYFRPLENYLHIFDKYGFTLLDVRENLDKIGALYVFRRNP